MDSTLLQQGSGTRGIRGALPDSSAGRETSFLLNDTQSVAHCDFVLMMITPFPPRAP
jgi:hypothetical protein